MFIIVYNAGVGLTCNILLNLTRPSLTSPWYNHTGWLCVKHEVNVMLLTLVWTFQPFYKIILLCNCHIIWWCMITVYMMRTILNLFPHFQKQCHVLNLKEVELGWIYLQVHVYLPWFSFSNLHIAGVDVEICKWHIIHQQTAPNQNCILYAFHVTDVLIV